LSHRPDYSAPAELIDVFSAVSAPLKHLIFSYLSGQAPQSLMLSGPFGVGKRTLAKLLVLCLFCENRTDAPCGKCKACRRITSGFHPNCLRLGLLPNTKSIKIDQVREILAQLSQYPLESGRRAVILEDFDLFTVPAQNALLKAIEEPDEVTVFILTATNEKSVLPTILSRCRFQRLPAWPDDLLESHLISQGFSTQTARDLVPLSGGSPGTAMRMAGNEDFWALKSRADTVLFSPADLSQIPEISEQLKEFRQEAEQLLNYLEAKALASFSAGAPEHPDPEAYYEASLKHRAMLESLFLARRQRASNVTWQGIADQLLLNILEDNQPCPW